MIKNEIHELGKTLHQQAIADRRHIHMHPELSFQEQKTGAYVQRSLEDIGVKFSVGWAEHGVVGIIEGNRPDSGVIALRADMDALPIREANDVPYKSRNEGVMHACGHDVHTASLLGAARILQSLKGRFDGSVKLIFQPGEEKMPGGASILIKEGVLDDPRPETILGQHVHPPLPAGHVGFRSGRYMASADEITLHVHGKGGHGAVPQLTIDPVVISAQIITALQTVVSRSSDPTTPSVLTFGKIQSDGGTFNVIPQGVKILGTFRTFDEVWRKDAHDRIRKIARGIAESLGATCDVQITVGYPFLVNDTETTDFCSSAAIDLLGDEFVHELPIRMTAEDFSYYSQEVPGCFYRLGVANAERNITSPVHTATFDIDESALVTGPTLMAWLAISRLGH